MKTFNSLHPLVRVILIGSLLTTLFRSFSYPFLTIYLTERTEMSLTTIGFVVGLGAFFSTIGGFVGGAFSDRLGRTRLMLLSLIFSSVEFFGIAIFSHVAVIAMLFSIGGFLGSFFSPVSRALTADLTQPELRMKVHSLRYLAINVGYCVGPLLGLYLGVVGGSFSFYLLGIVYLAYAGVLAVLFNRLGPSAALSQEDRQREQRISLNEAFSVLWRDRSLLMLVIGGILTTSVEGLWSVSMAAYLPEKFSNGEQLLATLLTINSVTVIISHFLLTKTIEKRHPFALVLVGSSLFALAELGYAAAGTPWQFSIIMVVFTIGEVLIVPAMYSMLDRIAPPAMIGTYFGAFALIEFGNFTGPWVSTYLLTNWGGQMMFVVLAFVSASSIVFYKLGSAPQRVTEVSLSHEKGA
ncbi:MFS transporter [Paenibacillus sediminis]|uniref:MFS family permease n=1 Tax=Paenibacillus sediminis TaxID=664909 RepID=A0ABS4H124_9BACL|nr:MFS transporter [Paenibacillus sediminis]MBP1936218.1 MFS family permease [Paenibacillus sediminis]